MQHPRHEIVPRMGRTSKFNPGQSHPVAGSQFCHFAGSVRSRDNNYVRHLLRNKQRMKHAYRTDKYQGETHYDHRGSMIAWGAVREFSPPVFPFPFFLSMRPHRTTNRDSRGADNGHARKENERGNHPYGLNLYNILGNGIVSRTCSIPHIHATVRSMPMPKPACGTLP